MTEDDLRALIEAHPVEGTPAAMRAAFVGLLAAALPGGPDLDGLDVTEGSRGGVRCLTVAPRAAASPPILYCHGGGYVLGSPKTHLPLAASLARAAHAPVILPAYPLAPEHPWPAQRDAVLAVARSFDGPFLAGGESAGGHLAISLALAGAGPRALLLFSPNTSRAYGLSGTRGAPRDAMLEHAMDDRLARMAFGSVRADDAEQSVIRADLSALPAVYMDVGTEEALLDDVLRLAARLARAGRPGVLRVRPGFHLLQAFAGAYPPADESLAAACAWVRAQRAESAAF